MTGRGRYPPTGMVTMTATFDDPPYKYWMYLVINEYLEDVAKIDSLVQVILNFGKLLGDKGNVVIPMKGAYLETRKQVLELEWESNVFKQLKETEDPYLIIIGSKLKDFVPLLHRFIVLFFKDGVSDPVQYIQILKEISEEIKSDRNIFKWKDGKDQNQPQGNLLRRIYDAIEIKPGAFGFSVDLKKLLLKME